jgi:hypothetical protein
VVKVLTPADTRAQGILGATGVTKNAKNPEKLEVFCLLDAL